jgi:hypothetical protein
MMMITEEYRASAHGAARNHVAARVADNKTLSQVDEPKVVAIALQEECGRLTTCAASPVVRAIEDPVDPGAALSQQLPEARMHAPQIVLGHPTGRDPALVRHDYDGNERVVEGLYRLGGARQ